jgi:hypothetical protein
MSRTALFVTWNLERGEIWRGWLRSAGYVAVGCVGPASTLDCPRLRGAPCPLRQAVDVAVVDVDAGPDAAVCTPIPDDGTTIYVGGDGPSRDRFEELIERARGR